MTENAFEEGKDAFYRGRTDADNPYPVESDDHLSWNDGYFEAEDSENDVDSPE